MTMTMPVRLLQVWLLCGIPAIFALDDLFSSSNTDLGYDLFPPPESVDSTLSASENSAATLLPFDDSPALLSFSGDYSASELFKPDNLASDLFNPDDLASDLFSTDLPVNWSLDEIATSSQADCGSYEEEGQLIGRVRQRADICPPTLSKEPSTDTQKRPRKKKTSGDSPGIEYIPRPRTDVIVPSLVDFDNTYCPNHRLYAICDSGFPEDRRTLDDVIYSLFHVTSCQSQIHPLNSS